VAFEVPEPENQKAIASRKRSSRGQSLDTLALLIPSLQFIQLKVVGVLDGSDLLLLGTFIAFAFRGEIRIANPIGKRFLALGSLWLASQCITDIVRHTAFADLARGWSNIGMTLVNFAVLWTLLYGRPQRLALYGWGIVVGTLLSFAINPSPGIADEPWKFGVSYAVNLTVMLLASREHRRRLWPVAAIAFLGMINIYLGTRNEGGVCLAVAVYLLISDFSRKGASKGSKMKAGTIVIFTASIIMGLGGIFSAYQYAAKSGILGEDAKDKYELQSSGKYGVLLGGRTELLASIPAVYDSPILGHGSWAKDRIYYIGEVRALQLLGYKGAMDLSREELIDGLIPAHSYLLQAWVYGGIVGALFWIWIYVLVARAIMRIYPPTVVLLPLAAFMAFSLFWDILFSPYGAASRIVVPYYIVTLATCMGMTPRKVRRAAAAVLKNQTGMAKRRPTPTLSPRPQQ
jgi:hypothetical protein